jgi:ferredoxin
VAARELIDVDTARCTGCAECIDECPTSALRSIRGAHLVSPALCDGCGTCVAACPEGALRLVLVDAVPFDPLAVALRREKLARLRALAGGGSSTATS